VTERSNLPPNALPWKKKLNKKNPKEATKFHAAVDKNTTLTLYKRDGGLYLIIKRDLADYELTATPSEAPIINQYIKTPDPFENLMIDSKIVEKEILPLNLAVQTAFGENKEMTLLSIKLAIGSGENDYVTIDESDLVSMEVEPTVSGLAEFVTANKESVIGICDRIFDHEKGNIILFETKLKDPTPNVSSLDFKLLSSLQQRGLYMQKNMRYAGVQLYVIIKAEFINDEIITFLNELGINWEMIFLRRDLSIEDWLEVECERNSINLKGFLGAKYPSLGFFDVNNIVRLAVLNQLTFKIVNQMAELLDHVKSQREELTGNNPDSEPLRKAEIVAAARLACKYFGVKTEIKMDKEIDLTEVLQFEAELIKS
jgi:hypothetical protein